MRTGTTVVLATLLMTSGPIGGFAQERVAEIEGIAAIVKGDLAVARDRALDDAKRKAVEQVAGTVVSSESITENFQLVEDRIYARASGFVRSYEILSERQEEGTYRVKIRATVDESALADDLALIFKVKPRVMVMIAEQNVGAKGFSYWWGSSAFVSSMDIMQNTLIEQWQPRGFKFVDPGLLKDKLKVSGPIRNPAVTNDDAVTIGRNADADVVLVGKVLVSDAGPVMDGVKMHSYHAVGTLRVLNVDTGEIIAVADDTGVAPHIDPNIGGRAAIKALAKKLGGTLERKIVRQWTEEATSAREIDLVLKGVKSSKMLTEVRRVLREEVRGIESAKTRRRRGAVAFVTVRVRATANDFARDLESKSFEGFKLAIDDVSKARVAMRIER